LTPARVWSRPVRHAPILAAAFALLALAACQPKIGDPCRTALQCSFRGERLCDLSNAENDAARQGECTIENCTRNSCPREATCVKTYPTEFLSVACDPIREDQWTEDPSDPEGELREPFDDCAPHEICLPEGLCADESSSRTSCRRECKRDSQCRDGYFCKRVGQDGVYRTPSPGNNLSLESETQICVPRTE
jgi:hypothetical protein